MAQRHPYLMEVQGLRSVAALLVAIYHVWLHRVSGGVDVFFVVAAYFLVAGFLRREPVGFRSVLDYYGATARRVLPGAALVVLATIVGAWAFMPDALWGAGLVHALGSILFVENWQLARDATDYLAQTLDTSPFQQMWALSLQVQVYIAFPLIYLIASLVPRLFGAGPRVVATVAFGAVFAGSLGFSIYLTQLDQSVAYFVTPTRLWEFAAGALLALWIHRIRVSPFAAKLIGWAGLAVLLLLGMVVDVSRAFPGIVAALPVGAALAIIVAAANGGNLRLLNNRVATGFADMSFAFYLWHWPLLIFLRYRLGSDDVGIVGGACVILAAILLAYASTRLVETPFRRWPWLEMRPVTSVVLSLAILCIPAAALQGWNRLLDTRVAVAIAERDAFLADPAAARAPGSLVPQPVMAQQDKGVLDTERCNQIKGESALISCSFGDPDGKATIVAVGGSHVAQWVTTLDAIARDQGYRLVVMTKDACTFTALPYQNRSCQSWNKKALKAIIELKPDLVFAIATRSTRKNGAIKSESVMSGYRKAFAALEREGIAVLGLRDNPWFVYDPAQCVSAFRPDWDRCGQPRGNVLMKKSPTAKVDAPNVYFADLSDAYCSADYCPAVKNGVLVYRDPHHLTGTFAYLQKDRMAAEIGAALERFAVPRTAAR